MKFLKIKSTPYHFGTLGAVKLVKKKKSFYYSSRRNSHAFATQQNFIEKGAREVGVTFFVFIK